jgi:hypothetical protein
MNKLQCPRVQISGKYSPDNQGLFLLRRRLVDAGIIVQFPRGDTIIDYPYKFAITIPEEAEVPFYKTQIEFFREIRQNHIQITFDIYDDLDGYVGESTGIETAYALSCNKPILMLVPPEIYSRMLPKRIQNLIEVHKSQIVIQDIREMTNSELTEFLCDFQTKEVNYGLSYADRRTIFAEMITLSRKYLKIWRQYKNSIS